MNKKTIVFLTSMVLMSSAFAINVSAETNVALQEEMEVTVESGDFVAKVIDVHDTEWKWEDLGRIIAVEMVIDNKSVDNNSNSGLAAYDVNKYIKVLDNEGFSCQRVDVSGWNDGDYRVNPDIAVGEKMRVAYPYAIPNDCDAITVVVGNEYKVDVQLNMESSNEEVKEDNSETEEIKADVSENTDVEELEKRISELEEENKKLDKQVKKLQRENKDLKEKQKETESEQVSEVEIETQTEETVEETEYQGTVYNDVVTVRAVQEKLNSLGFNCGTPDGIAGQKTADAINAYAKENGLPETGVITDELLDKMGVAEEIKKKAELEASKAEYSADYSYDQLARNPDSYVGNKMKFSGKVLQAETGDVSYMRLAINDDYHTVLSVTYGKDVIDFRLLDDDRLTVYGTSNGVYSYESVGSGTITIPWITADIIELN